MTMYEGRDLAQRSNGNEDLGQHPGRSSSMIGNAGLTGAISAEIRNNERMAQTLNEEATRQWSKAVEGMLALPAAMALGVASTALYVAAFIERGFEAFQLTTQNMRQSMNMQQHGMQGQESFQQRYGSQERGNVEPGSSTPRA